MKACCVEAKCEGAMNFQKALKSIPSCIGGYDPMRHKTVADLIYLVQTELDMFDEGEQEADIRDLRQCRQAKKWLVKMGAR